MNLEAHSNAMIRLLRRHGIGESEIYNGVVDVSDLRYKWIRCGYARAEEMVYRMKMDKIRREAGQPK